MVDFLKKLFNKKQKSDNSYSDNKKLKILLYGDVDMNLIDGSSIWLNSLIQVLALEKNFHLTVLLKARLNQNRLLADLQAFENVSIVNTFKYFSEFWFENKNRLTVDDALRLLNQLDDENNFDTILLRGYELCDKAIHAIDKPDRIVPYIVNYTHDPDAIDKDEIEKLRRIYDAARLVFAQTNEMKAMLNDLLGYKDDKICILTPMIPVFPEKKPDFKNNNNTLVYTGKFSNDYMLYETLQAFRKINHGSYKFNIAGDKFHLDLRVPKEELISIMQTMPNVCWAKGLPREGASKLIENSDLGLCWRSTRIDNEKSLELSTKVLEYGRLGKPVLIRRIPIHERLLGQDYPFYVSDANDLVDKLQLAFQDAELYAKAAQHIYDVSRFYAFDKAIERIKPFLAKFN